LADHPRVGRVEVVIDTTRDQFGDQLVVRQTCTGPTPATVFTFSECSELTPTTPCAGVPTGGTDRTVMRP
jgi:hypothetical protein